MGVKYVKGGVHDLDKIGRMWEKLNLHHLKLAKHFKEVYKKMTFAARKKELLKKAVDKEMMVEIAYDTLNNKPAGYCVSTAKKNGEGEVESLYVDSDRRSHGVGRQLMKNALGWMEKHKVKTKKIVVFAGNENVMGFYALSGFYPRHIILQQEKGKRSK